MLARLYVVSTRLAVGLVLSVALLLTALVVYPPLDGTLIVGGANLDAYLQGLPALHIPALPERSVLLDTSGNPIATFYSQNRIDVALNQVSPWVISALLSAEDRTFYTNDGIDPRGILRAFVNNLHGGPTQGGSTITQQYIKNLIEIETNTQAPQSITRKIHEIAYARQLTREMTKSQILNGYLNTVYFGEGAYGIQAAALRYFSIPAASLTLSQAAMLVALVEDPSGYDPITNPGLATQMRNRVLTMMVTNHDLSSARASMVAASPLGLNVQPLSPNGCTTSPDPYFCEWVWNSLLQLPELGATPAIRAANLRTGGYTIYTTLNPSDQAAAQAAAISKVGYSDRVGSAIVSVTPGTGAVTAMAQNRIWGIDVAKNQTEVNYATSPSPVGSTFKAFTLVAALARGISPNAVIPAGARYHSTTLANPPGGYFTNAEAWTAPYISLATATADSVNTAFVQLEQRVGVLNVARMAYKMGLRSLPLSGPHAVTANEGSLTLGARGFTPLEMASAYATLAAGGQYCHPLGVLSITTRSGHAIAVSPRCSQVIPAALARTESSLLQNVVTYGTGTAAYVPHQTIAGKTGTTQNFGSAWFIGYTPNLATASWMGDPRGTKYPLYNVDGVGAVFGGTLPAEEFALAMNQELNVTVLPTNPLTALVPTSLEVPNVYGLPGPLAASRLRSLGFHIQGNVPTVARSTTPAAGTWLAPGTFVTIVGGRP